MAASSTGATMTTCSFFFIGGPLPAVLGLASSTPTARKNRGDTTSLQQRWGHRLADLGEGESRPAPRPAPFERRYEPAAERFKWRFTRDDLALHMTKLAEKLYY